jgi:hypothetical protein
MNWYLQLKSASIVWLQRAGLAAVLEFIMSSPVLKPNKISDDEDKNKSLIELRLIEPLLIANKKMRIYSSASIAANPCCLQYSSRSLFIVQLM